MYNLHQPNPRKDRCRLPEVADAPTQESEPAEEPSDSHDELSQFKVFLKRNLRPQSPPADLLAGIRARLDEVRAAD